MRGLSKKTHPSVWFQNFTMPRGGRHQWVQKGKPCDISKAGLQMEEERKKHEPLSETQQIQQRRNDAVLRNAEAMLLEEKDEVKNMNQIIMYGKCVTIRYVALASVCACSIHCHHAESAFAHRRFHVSQLLHFLSNV